MGQPNIKSVGSTAVDQFVRTYQIPIALHGHIHDSRGWKQIGKTLCINPGSEYFVGALNGAIVDLGNQGVRRFQLTIG